MPFSRGQSDEMELDEALRELGLLATATAAERRSAYLRLLKVRKPEVDPDGFRRLRAAYERAQRPASTAPRSVVAPAWATREPHPPPTLSRAPEIAPPAAAADRPDASAAAAHAAAAAALAETDLARAARTLRAFFDGPEPPSPSLVKLTFGLLFDLHEAGSAELARGLCRSLGDVVARTGVESRLLRGDLLVSWAFLRELDRLPLDFPEPLRRILAEGCRTGAFLEARDRWFAIEGKAVRHVAELRARAPRLADHLAIRILPPRPWRRVLAALILVAGIGGAVGLFVVMTKLYGDGDTLVGVFAVAVVALFVLTGVVPVDIQRLVASRIAAVFGKRRR